MRYIKTIFIFLFFTVSSCKFGGDVCLIPMEIVMVSGGDSHTLILGRDGTVWATGRNNWGQLGTGDNANTNVFTKVASGVKMIAAGANHSLILKEDGTVWATGYTYKGQLGNGESGYINGKKVVFIKVASGVKMIAAGANHSLILKEDGTVWATGWNSDGQLGAGDNIDKNLFTKVASNVKMIAARYQHSLVLKEDGTVWATGSNSFGKLGTGDNIDKNLFTKVASNVKMIAAGGDHSLILKEDGTVWATGWNSDGQLGAGDNIDKNLFTKVASNVKMIAAGDQHSLVLKEDGTVWATGYNFYGQLGTGESGADTDKNLFTKVASGVKMIAAGGVHSLILKKDGTVWVTGWNDLGQLGNGSTGGSINVFTKIDNKTFSCE